MVWLHLLAPLGFDITLATDGREGVEKAKIVCPDVIRLDLVMPVMTGFEMIKIIRTIPAIKDVPIVVISASVFETDKEQSLNLGCQGFLSKPIDAEKLFALIAQLLQIEWIDKSAHFGPQMSEPNPMLDEKIVPPPREELEKLDELTLFGDLKKVREKVDAIAATDPRYGDFARVVRTDAQKLEDVPILELLAEYLELRSQLEGRTLS